MTLEYSVLGLAAGGIAMQMLINGKSVCAKETFDVAQASAIGRERGIWGLEEFCDLQVLSAERK